MEELKTLFGEGSLTYDEFTAKCQEQNIKLANLGSGLYVDKAKLDRTNNSLNELKEQYKALADNTKTYEADMKELLAFREEKANQGFMDKITGAKIDNKYAKFVLSEVKSQVNEENKFDDVLAKYVKENPQFLTTRTGVFTKGTSTPDLESGSEPSKSENQQMNEIFRSFREN